MALGGAPAAATFAATCVGCLVIGFYAFHWP
jgi:hypothetical protein